MAELKRSANSGIVVHAQWALHGGADGWFKLKDVEADARSIRAHAAVAAFHNPKIYIDRVTGTISISGKSGDYTGQCQAKDPNAAAKF